ncbi:uncharacterized protein LOC123327309 [Drosophila simulans]|uniref:uncharacterized protein LOC123327309 n=1 Tax=Drosophila simulans TaxID=7240 RepID=UPI001D101A64|nr:uncharacterized protein LOC123327309 [Drosophila simulans]
MSGKNNITPGGSHICGNPPSANPEARARILEALPNIPPIPAPTAAHLAVGTSNATSASKEEESLAFGKRSKVLRTPPQNPSDGTPKRPLEATSPPTRAQLAKRVKTPQLEIEEMGEILDDLLTKVNLNGVRSINLAMKNSFARLKELQLKLRTRLPEAEKTKVGRTAKADASQQTTPKLPSGLEEPCIVKGSPKPKDRTALSAKRAQRPDHQKAAGPKRLPRAPPQATVAGKKSQPNLQQPPGPRKKRPPRERPDASQPT